MILVLLPLKMNRKYITENYFFKRTTQLLNTRTYAHMKCITDVLERHTILKDNCILPLQCLQLKQKYWITNYRFFYSLIQTICMEFIIFLFVVEQSFLQIFWIWRLNVVNVVYIFNNVIKQQMRNISSLLPNYMKCITL